MSEKSSTSGGRSFLKRTLLVAAGVGLSSVVTASFAADRSATSFLPTWKLLGPHEKEQFVAGYLQGWQDAARVTDIAIGYVKTNPNKAIEGLEGIRQLYDVKGVKPMQLAGEIDAFYADPENSAAPLSLAITSAKRRLSQ